MIDSQSDGMDASRAPLVEHLIELRKRLKIILLAWMAGFLVSYLFKEQVYGFLTQPLANAFENGEGRRLIYTQLTETFFTYVKLSIFAGFFGAFPVIAAQFYGFIAPGLYRNERHVLLPYLFLSPILFFLGAALAYYQVFPLAWKFFIAFESASGMPLPIELEAKVSDYLTLVMQVLFAFGIAFQLPVVLNLLVRAGLVEIETLVNGRKYALIIIVIAAALLTPPDIISQIALAIPLYLLYEISILSSKWLKKRTVEENA